MANTTKIVYVTQAQYDALVTNGSVTVGGVTYTYDANNTYLVREDGIEGADVKSTGATSGKVLTADGNGGASWQTAGGGGGSGDVTASGTLTSDSIILGNGAKSVKAMATGTLGQFLHRGQNGPEWKGLYRHTMRIYYPGDEMTGELIMYVSVISTDSAAYTSLDAIPDGWHIATGDYNDVFDGNGHCRVFYFDRGYNQFGYWETVNESESAKYFISPESATLTDHVEPI